MRLSQRTQHCRSMAGDRHGMAGAQHGHGKVSVHRPLECKNVTARPLNTGYEILPAQSS